MKLRALSVAGAVLSAGHPIIALAQEAAPSFAQLSETFEEQAHCIVWGATGRPFRVPLPDASHDEKARFLKESSGAIYSDCQKLSRDAIKSIAENPAYFGNAFYVIEFGQAIARVHAELDMLPLIVENEGGAPAVDWFHDATERLQASYLPCLEDGLRSAGTEEFVSRDAAWALGRKIDAQCREARQAALDSLPMPIADFTTTDWVEGESRESVGLRERLRDWWQLVIAYHAGLKGTYPINAVYMKSLPDPAVY